MRNFFVIVILLIAGAYANGLELTGNLVQGGLVFGQVQPGAKVLLGKQQVVVDDAGRFVLGFDRDAALSQQLSINGELSTLEIASREYKVQRIGGIARNIMNPSESDLQRIRKESAQIKKARALAETRRDFDSGFKWPLFGPITGVYGSQRVYNGVPSRPHYGVDIAAPTGTPARAPADGVVTLAHPGMFYSGGTLIIDHGHGLSSSFLHLSKVLAKVGDVVKKGQVVAEVGATGRVTGAHLDWRMNWHGARVDPQLLVDEMPSDQTDSAQ